MVIQTHALTKRYGELAALEGCSLAVAPGEVYGLLGPNGAGKTTLLRLLTGFLRPTAGRAVIDGLDCHRQSLAVRTRVAYLPGEARLFRRMRGRDVVRFFARVRRTASLGEAHRLAERLQLDLAPRVALMSTGMRQKLALVVTLAAGAPILILDEPTANLDPTVRADVLSLVREMHAAGRTVLFSSHVFAEVEEVCDRVGILRAGRLVHVETMSKLRRQHRIHGRLLGPLHPPPEPLGRSLTIEHGPDSEVTILAAGELAPLLGWLATLPLAEVHIEPVGLRAVYEQFQQGRNVAVASAADLRRLESTTDGG